MSMSKNAKRRRDAATRRVRAAWVNLAAGDATRPYAATTPHTSSWAPVRSEGRAPDVGADVAMLRGLSVSRDRLRAIVAHQQADLPAHAVHGADAAQARREAVTLRATARVKRASRRRAIRKLAASFAKLAAKLRA